MRAFLQQAEDILEIAASGDTTMRDVAIVLDRQGGMRMMDPTGWTLPALTAEFGATAVYRVERRGVAVRVEGFDGSQRCLLQRELGVHNLFHSTAGAGARQARMLLPPVAATA